MDAFNDSGIKFPSPLGAAEELFLRKPTHEFLIDTIMLRSSKPPGRMSEMGQKQTLQCACVMSALPSKADIAESDRDVHFVPKADIRCAAHLESSRAFSAAR